MYCKNCGTGLSGKFCTNCGTPCNETIESKMENNKYLHILDKAYGIYGKNKIGFSSYLVSELRISFKEANKIRDDYLLEKGNEKPPSFSERFQYQVSTIQEEDNGIKMKIAENKSNGIVCCPKCSSTSLSANKKGFGIGKAVVGASLTGGIGLVAGNIGA